MHCCTNHSQKGVIIWIVLLGVSGFVQITGETVGEVKAVAGMHQRKAEMAKHSDAFIALPGWFPFHQYSSFNDIYSTCIFNVFVFILF